MKTCLYAVRPGNQKNPGADFAPGVLFKYEGSERGAPALSGFIQILDMILFNNINAPMDSPAFAV